MGSLDDLRFTNRFTAAFPADPSDAVVPRPVREFYSRVRPTPVSDPQVVASSPEVADLLGLDEAEFDTPRFAQVFGGNELVDGMDPFAMNYAGHQFGNFAGQLGDGRAIALGEVETPSSGHQTLQLKGAGPTPYSRRADGRAVLRSSIREFLCSEAMFHLGVPTTRALSLVLTGDEVVRDMFYDGHPAPEPGAIVCRVAPSFVRFGHFELPSSRRDQNGLAALARFVLETEFPALAAAGEPGPDTWVEMLGIIAERTAQLMAHWMRVGFVHGVMNTDNLSVGGLTIDYGPYGWVDDFDPGWTPNTTDAQNRRYRYGQQPTIAYWNLGQLANAIYPLVGEAEGLQAALDRYPAMYRELANRATAAKLGLPAVPTPDDDGDVALFAQMYRLLAAAETDFTIFFQNLAALSSADLSNGGAPPLLDDAFYGPPSAEVVDGWAQWRVQYCAELQAQGVDDDARQSAARAASPRYVLRNYLAQEAIEKAEAGDYAMVHRLQDVLCRPYEYQPDAEDLFARRPDWARTKPGASALSCSS